MFVMFETEVPLTIDTHNVPPTYDVLAMVRKFHKKVLDIPIPVSKTWQHDMGVSKNRGTPKWMVL